MSLDEILNEALLDEYKARDTYRKVIDTYGPVRPFVNIVEAEQRHIDLLLPLYRRYGIALPPAPDPAHIRVPGSLHKACQEAAQAEIDNAAMYVRLIASTDLADVRGVLLRLQAASRDHHLPAFRRCLERGGATGPGPELGPGRGKGAGPGAGGRWRRGVGPGRRGRQ